MRHLFIINPVAGKHMDVDAVSAEITEAMAGSADKWEIWVTTAPGDAETRVRDAAEEALASSDQLRVYAIGGDGTLNEVVNAAAGLPHVAVASCPRGSGNDFARIFDDCHVDLKKISNLIACEPARFDLIECMGRYAVNVCGVGVDARIAADISKYKDYPLVSGPMSYLISLVTHVFKGIYQNYAIELDGRRMRGGFSLMTALNGQYYGGGFHPCPDSRPDDGELDFVLVRDVSRLMFARLVVDYAKGRGYKHPRQIMMKKGRVLKIKCDEVNVVTVDGESYYEKEFIIKLSDKKLNYLVPAGFVRTV